MNTNGWHHRKPKRLVGFACAIAQMKRTNLTERIVEEEKMRDQLAIQALLEFQRKPKSTPEEKGIFHWNTKNGAIAAAPPCTPFSPHPGLRTPGFTVSGQNDAFRSIITEKITAETWNRIKKQVDKLDAKIANGGYRPSLRLE